MSYFIIAVDGGGIRGVLPALLLQSVGQSRIDQAQFFAGTSTGALLVVGLASGVPIDTIAATYLDPATCHKIFTPYVGSAAHAASQPHSLLGEIKAKLQSEEEKLLHTMLGNEIEELLLPKYTAEGLREVIASFPQVPATLGAIGPKVFLPVFELDADPPGAPSGPQWQATAFHNLTADAGFGGHPEAPPADAILASAAAPLYFPPHEYAGHRFIDGGVMAQNPTMYALAAATRAGVIGPRGVPFDQVTVLSIGTGRNESSYPPPAEDFPPPYGMLGWSWPRPRGSRTPAFPLTDAILDGVAELTHYQVEAMVGADSYRRVQIDLGTRAMAMDDCSSALAPDGLKAKVDAYLHTAEWQQVLAWLDQRLR